MDIATMLRYWSGYYVWLLWSIELNLLLFYQVLDLMLKCPAIVSVVPDTVRMVGAFSIRMIMRRGCIHILWCLLDGGEIQL